MSGFTYQDWQNGAPPPPGFKVYGSSGDTSTPAPPPPFPPPPPRRERKRSSASRWVAGIAILVVLALVRYAVTEGIDRARGVRRFAYGTTLSTPERVGTMPRMHGAEARAIERETVAGIAESHQPQVAVYGRGSTPRYFLFAALSGERSNGEAYSEMKAGLEQERGVTVGAPKTMPGDLACGTVRFGSERGAMCAWASDLSNGVLIDYAKADPNALARLAVVTRNLVNKPSS